MQKKRILVVDRDQDSSNALRTILLDLGFDAVIFDSDEQVMNAISGQRIDLALLDAALDGANRCDFRDRLTRTPEFESLVVIFLTDPDRDEEILKLYQHGADYVLERPVSAERVEYGLNLFLADISGPVHDVRPRQDS